MWRDMIVDIDFYPYLQQSIAQVVCYTITVARHVWKRVRAIHRVTGADNNHVVHAANVQLETYYMTAIAFRKTLVHLSKIWHIVDMFD